MEKEVAHDLHNFEEYIQKCKNKKRKVNGLAWRTLNTSNFCRMRTSRLQNFAKKLFPSLSLSIGEEKANARE